MSGWITGMMTALAAGYVFCVYRAAAVVFAFHKEREEREMLSVKDVCQKRLLEQDSVLTRKRGLEERFRALFTLYDMTREISKSFSVEEAFQIFQQKLQQNIVFEVCRFLDPDPDEAARFQDDPRYLLFPLEGKKELLGYVLVEGAESADRDRIGILVNQFSLVFRRIRLYKEVEGLAIMDSLTQVFTRRYVLERLEEELDRARVKGFEVSFLMLDVDFFKQVNDRYGHPAGDAVLRAVARRILDNVREIDIVGRYGGEEFCVVLPDAGADGASQVAERIRQSMERRTVDVYDIQIAVTASIGIAVFPAHAKKAATLIDKADWALYRSKKVGRNRVSVFGVYDDNGFGSAASG